MEKSVLATASAKVRLPFSLLQSRGFCMQCFRSGSARIQNLLPDPDHVFLALGLAQVKLTIKQLPLLISTGKLEEENLIFF
jgi:hypothetical protein